MDGGIDGMGRGRERMVDLVNYQKIERVDGWMHGRDGWIVEDDDGCRECG